MRVKWGPVYCQAVATDEEEETVKKILRAHPANYKQMPRYKLRDREGNRLWDGFNSLVSEHGRFLTGLLPKLRMEGELYDLEIKVEGSEAPELPVEVEPIGADFLNDGVPLFAWQTRMTTSALRWDTRCILKGATRSGKTRVMSALAKYHQDKSVIVMVPSSDLFDQIVEEMTNHLQEQIGIIRGWGNWHERRVTVAMIPTLYKYRYKPRFEELAARTGLLLLDECQCASSPSVRKVVEKFTTRHKVFLSGTPLNKDDYRNLITTGLSAGIAETVTSAELQKAGRIATPHIFPRLIPPATDEEVAAHPPPFNIFKFRGDHDLKDLEFNKARAIMKKRLKMRLAYYHWAFLWGVEENPYVKWVIRKDCEWYVQHGFPVWIPVDTKRHGQKLLNLLSDLDAVYLDKDDHVSVRTAERKAFNTGRRAILISTPIFNVGIDFPSLKAIIPAGGGKAIDDLLQILGRGQMVKTGSNTYYVTDFRNRWNYKLLEHSLKREAIYESTNIAVIHDMDAPLTLLEAA